MPISAGPTSRSHSRRPAGGFHAVAANTTARIPARARGKRASRSLPRSGGKSEGAMALRWHRRLEGAEETTMRLLAILGMSLLLVPAVGWAGDDSADPLVPWAPLLGR